MVFETDSILVKEISQGNKVAFDELFKKYYIPLRNYANRITRDINISEDIIQDVFFNIWIKHKEIDRIQHIGAYIRSAVHNESISFLRNKVKNHLINIEDSTIPEFEKLYSEIFQYQDTIIQKELPALIAQAINTLPDQCRTVFILSRSFGFKNREIAAQLNISIKAVEKHITKALSILREHLKEYIPLLTIWLFSQL